MKKPTILHIAAHLGGGVGRFYKNIFGGDVLFDHRYALLEEPRDIALLPAKGKWFVIDSLSSIMADLENADIIQVEFWNHPLLYYFFSQIRSWPKCRLVLYSHVSGLFPPAYLPPTVARVADRLILATYAAAFSDAAREQQGAYKVIPEFGGADRTVHLNRNGHSGFRVLYLGTADPLKIHPDLIDWCVELHRRDPELIFTFCTQDSSSSLKSQVPADSTEAFEFFERLEDLSELMSTSDVFGYALQPRHYGTGEQALLEAMGAGLVPVVLDNPAERFIVEHGVTGVVARNAREYKESILFLKQNTEITLRLGSQARQHVREFMSAEKTQSAFHSVYHEIIENMPKKSHEFTVSENALWELFLLSQGPDARIFEDALNDKDDISNKFARWQLGFLTNHKAPSKGTITHWSRSFPQDTKLSKLHALMTESDRIVIPAESPKKRYCK